MSYNPREKAIHFIKTLKSSDNYNIVISDEDFCKLIIYEFTGNLYHDEETPMYYHISPDTNMGTNMGTITNESSIYINTGYRAETEISDEVKIDDEARIALRAEIIPSVETISTPYNSPNLVVIIKLFPYIDVTLPNLWSYDMLHIMKINDMYKVVCVEKHTGPLCMHLIINNIRCIDGKILYIDENKLFSLDDVIQIINKISIMRIAIFTDGYGMRGIYNTNLDVIFNNIIENEFINSGQVISRSNQINLYDVNYNEFNYNIYNYYHNIYNYRNYYYNKDTDKNTKNKKLHIFNNKIFNYVIGIILFIGDVRKIYCVVEYFVIKLQRLYRQKIFRRDWRNRPPIDNFPGGINFHRTMKRFNLNYSSVLKPIVNQP